MEELLEDVKYLGLKLSHGFNFESNDKCEKILMKVIEESMNKVKPIIHECIRLDFDSSLNNPVSEFEITFKYVNVLIFLGNPVNNDLTLMDVADQYEKLLPLLNKIMHSHRTGACTANYNEYALELIKKAEKMCVYGERLMKMPIKEALKEAEEYDVYWQKLIANKIRIKIRNNNLCPEELVRFLSKAEPYKSVIKELRKGDYGVNSREWNKLHQKFLVGVLVSLLIASQFVQLAKVYKEKEEERKKKEPEDPGNRGWWRSFSWFWRS
ncbi:unnamed protein product [Orchesella dallaii]|uniref:Uncharacterized protein n=1 Tax=Orchesella dallaii TaxID=48710 RepID=A0ABP1RA92_9HEXA